jgi:hypothetical protein
VIKVRTFSANHRLKVALLNARVLSRNGIVPAELFMHEQLHSAISTHVTKQQTILVGQHHCSPHHRGARCARRHSNQINHAEIATAKTVAKWGLGLGLAWLVIIPAILKSEQS